MYLQLLGQTAEVHSNSIGCIASRKEAKPWVPRDMPHPCSQSDAVARDAAMAIDSKKMSKVILKNQDTHHDARVNEGHEAPQEGFG
jgi:hypothetical protein